MPFLADTITLNYRCSIFRASCPNLLPRQNRATPPRTAFSYTQFSMLPLVDHPNLVTALAHALTKRTTACRIRLDHTPDTPPFHLLLKSPHTTLPWMGFSMLSMILLTTYPNPASHYTAWVNGADSTLPERIGLITGRSLAGSSGSISEHNRRGHENTATTSPCR